MTRSRPWPTAARAVRSAPQPSLLVRFGVIAAVVVTALGVVLGRQLKAVISDRARDNAVRSAMVYLQLGARSSRPRPGRRSPAGRSP